MFVIQGQNQPIKVWLSDESQWEEGAKEQAIELAKLPFLHQWVSIMPDTHQGYGMPIGGVIATIGAVIPNAVGVDIGCGMKARKTNLTSISKDHLRSILKDIKNEIPLGHKHHQEQQPSPLWDTAPDDVVINQQIQSAKYQLGTLGGGNHFIEIQEGSDGHIWIMLHSGSRNLGKRVCDHYCAIAKKLNLAYHSPVPKDLYFLAYDSNEGQAYLKAMKFCMDFAEESRLLMLNKITEIIKRYYPKMEFEQAIDTHHNYAAMEHHYGMNVLVHRKGAVKAKDLVIIPGSMGTKSYIAKGLENSESFCSCSHGAGRRMSRSEANKTFTVDDRLTQMGDTIYMGGRDDVDEVPLAYKDIDVVIENQKDLVEPVVELRPLGVVKG